MKNKIVLLLILTILLVACKSQSKDFQELETLTYSNLADERTRENLSNELLEMGIEKEKIDRFIYDVSEYNRIIENISLVENDFESIDTLIPQYDIVEIMHKLDAEKPGVFGHNCRLTSFRLLDDYIEIENPIIEDDSMLFAEKDMMSIDNNLIEEKRQEDFFSLFSYIDTINSNDVKEHIEVFKKNWEDKKVKFTNDKISLISVIFYTNIEEKDDTAQLFIGHTGLLWKNDQGVYYFLEKLSFTDPYQLIKFASKTNLRDYLMNKYDVDETGKLPAPFIFENENLLDEYF